MAPNVRKLSDKPDMLGETPVWDWRTDTLYWVDGVNKSINSSDQDGRQRREYILPSKVGSIGLVADDTSQLVVALADGVYLYNMANGELIPVFKLPDDETGVRFNDGKVDPYGNFLVGTLTMEGTPRGKLYRIASNGKVAILKTGIAIPNAICFTPDGQHVYFADSIEGCVKLYKYLPDTDKLGEPIQILDTKALGSAPDGACVDAGGNFWVTLVQNGKIAKFNAAGHLAEMFDAPVDTPSCVAFGGESLQTLYLTSIKDTGTGRVVSSHPEGGHLFAFEDPSYRGMKDYLFS